MPSAESIWKLGFVANVVLLPVSFISFLFYLLRNDFIDPPPPPYIIVSRCVYVCPRCVAVTLACIFSLTRMCQGSRESYISFSKRPAEAGQIKKKKYRDKSHLVHVRLVCSDRMNAISSRGERIDKIKINPNNEMVAGVYYICHGITKTAMNHM